MAEFCKQCADELNLNPPGGIPYDFEMLDETDDNVAFAALCEGCGIIAVNRKGECLGNCMQGHNNTEIYDYRKDEKWESHITKECDE